MDAKVVSLIIQNRNEQRVPKKKPWADHVISTLRIIIAEHSIELRAPLCLLFVDFERAVYSIDRYITVAYTRLSRPSI